MFKYTNFENFHRANPSLEGRDLEFAKKVFAAAREEKVEAPPKPLTLTVMDQEEWQKSRVDDGECACRICWNRYIEFYGNRNA